MAWYVVPSSPPLVLCFLWEPWAHPRWGTRNVHYFHQIFSFLPFPHFFSRGVLPSSLFFLVLSGVFVPAVTCLLRWLLNARDRKDSRWKYSGGKGAEGRRGRKVHQGMPVVLQCSQRCTKKELLKILSSSVSKWKTLRLWIDTGYSNAPETHPGSIENKNKKNEQAKSRITKHATIIATDW